MSKQPLKILVIEDSSGDVELLRCLLEDAGYDAVCRQVYDIDSLQEELKAGGWDVVISDYTLPRFNGLDALRLFKKYDLDCPFIIVSGTIGEESAVLAMKTGAHDYVLKDNLGRLVSAIRRGLAETHTRILHKRVARELKDSEEKFRTMAEAIPQIILTSNPDGKIDYWNQRWFDYTNMNEEASLGWGWMEALHPEDAPTCLAAWWHSLESGIPYQTECRIKKADEDRYCWHLWRAHAVCDEDGKVVKWFGSFTDIEAQKSVEQAMLDTNQRLMHLNQMRSELTSVISHELKTPLTVIREGVQIILEKTEGPLTSGQQKTLEVTVNNIDRLTNLIGTVLNFEKVESGCWDTRFRTTDLNSLTAELCALMQLACRKKAIRLVYTPALESVSAVCDADKIREVLLNLLDNAIKFTSKNGTVQVSLCRVNDVIHLEVCDNGIGIRKEDQEKIFDIFSQSFNKYSGNISGSGVGLAVCKRIINEHHGRISIESELGKGTRFLVEFPVRQAAGDFLGCAGAQS